MGQDSWNLQYGKMYSAKYKTKEGVPKISIPQKPKKGVKQVEELQETKVKRRR